MDVSKILLLPSRIKQQLDIKSFMPFNIKCNLNYFTDIENAHISTIKLLLRVPISTRSCYTAVYALHHILKGYTYIKNVFQICMNGFYSNILGRRSDNERHLLCESCCAGSSYCNRNLLCSHHNRK